MRGVVFYLLLIAFSGCGMFNSKNKKEVTFTPGTAPGPPTMVYKTKKKYYHLVPVILSDDKKTVASYPDPKDVMTDGKPALPTPLKKGYYLDNRGINLNVAFINKTYEEYSKLTELPTPEVMMSWVIDNDPLSELCDCGNRNVIPDAEKQMNELIQAKKLRTLCKALK
ncbi:MAG: hypothetical protein GC181_12540 [Bacteroidetes bacterium]|nr:hypothetical protein [Bacteroidota bacterium]